MLVPLSVRAESRSRCRSLVNPAVAKCAWDSWPDDQELFVLGARRTTSTSVTVTPPKFVVQPRRLVSPGLPSGTSRKTNVSPGANPVARLISQRSFQADSFGHRPGANVKQPSSELPDPMLVFRTRLPVASLTSSLATTHASLVFVSAWRWIAQTVRFWPSRRFVVNSIARPPSCRLF